MRVVMGLGWRNMEVHRSSEGHTKGAGETSIRFPEVDRALHGSLRRGLVFVLIGRKNIVNPSFSAS